jgi:hypothetical protein
LDQIDLQAILGDAGTIALISTALVVAIQFIKVLYYKLPWGWIQKTPGEVWFVLSIIAGIGVAVAFNYQVLMDSGEPLLSRFGTVLYGLTIGAGSKVVHAIATTAGAKFGSIKLNAETPVSAPATPEPIEPAPISEPILGVSAPVIVEEVATPEPPEVVMVQRMKDNKTYIMIDGKKYFITGKFLELDVDE